MSVFYKDMYRANIRYIGDVTKTCGDFLTYGELRHIFPHVKINFLSYQGLINAIPCSWKQVLKSGRRDDEAFNDEGMPGPSERKKDTVAYA